MRLESILTGILTINAIVSFLQVEKVVMDIGKVIKHVSQSFIFWMVAYHVSQSFIFWMVAYLVFVGSHTMEMFHVSQYMMLLCKLKSPGRGSG